MSNDLSERMEAYRRAMLVLVETLQLITELTELRMASSGDTETLKDVKALAVAGSAGAALCMDKEGAERVLVHQDLPTIKAYTERLISGGIKIGHVQLASAQTVSPKKEVVIKSGIAIKPAPTMRQQQDVLTVVGHRVKGKPDAKS